MLKSAETACHGSFRCRTAENVVTDGCQGFRLPVRIVTGVVVWVELEGSCAGRPFLSCGCHVWMCVQLICFGDDGEQPSREWVKNYLNIRASDNHGVAVVVAWIRPRIRTTRTGLWFTRETREGFGFQPVHLDGMRGARASRGKSSVGCERINSSMRNERLWNIGTKFLVKLCKFTKARIFKHFLLQQIFNSQHLNIIFLCE